MILKPKDMPRPKVPAVIVEDDGREVCSETKAGKEEYKRRKFQMFDRQRGLCCICGLPMNRDTTATFDHEEPRGMNGWKRDDRIEVDGKRKNGCAHIWCNVKKGSRKIPYKVQ